MKPFHVFFTRVARSAKSNTGYSFDPRLTTKSLFLFALERLLMVFRGLVHRVFFGSCKGLLFVGKNVTIRHKHQIRCGKGVTFKDGVVVDALCDRGILIGDNVAIGKHAIIECTGVIRTLGEELSIGDNSNIGDLNFIAVRGPISIGKNVLIGPRVSMHAENHVFDRTDIPIKEQGERRKGIVIDDDVWIGAGAIILDGVHIGKGAIVAAGCVVTQDVEFLSIVGGIPARVLSRRTM